MQIGNATFTPAPELIAGLTEQELRIVAKTTIRLNEEAKRGKRFANAYLANLTPIQTAALQKFAAVTDKHMTQRERDAFTAYGLR